MEIIEEQSKQDRRRADVLSLLSESSNFKSTASPLGMAKTSLDFTAQAHPRAYDIHDFDSYPEVKAFNKTKALLAKCGVENPYFRVNQSIANNHTHIDGQTLIHYSGYNYLGLSGHPEVNQRARDAINTYGTSPSASRLAAGEKPIHGELETKLAEFIGTESALIYAGGHATNVTVIGHMFNSQDLIIYDELSHNSVVEGCILSGARRMAFNHNDVSHCESIIKENLQRSEKIVIIVEGAYSMDGDLAPLDEFARLRKKYPILLYVDEAHSLGTVGKTGRGVREYFNLKANEIDFWMGTLSKSLASNGGYIAGSSSLINYLKYTTPGFVYAAGITPANAAAALASLELLEHSPERVKRLSENANRFRRLAKAADFDTGPSANTPIVPIIMGKSETAILMADALFKKGVNVHPMFYPAVPMNEARLRFFITSEHTFKDIDNTIDAMLSVRTELKL